MEKNRAQSRAQLTVSEVAAQFSKDKERTKKAVEKEINESSVVTMLLMIRHDRGLTQTDVAKRMNCSPSKVSRIEAGTDAQVNLVDLYQYANALDVRTTILFEPTDTRSSLLIKHFVYGIQERLEHLANIARGSEDGDIVADKIHTFFGEVLFNVVKKFSDVYSTLPHIDRQVKRKHPESERDDQAAEAQYTRRSMVAEP